MTLALHNESPTVHISYTPHKRNGWSCAMHMFISSLSAIYQGQVLILQYGQRHVDQLSRIHLRYVLTGEIAPRIDKLITYIIDPLNNEDMESHSKTYSTGGTELPGQELARNTTKRRKTQHIVQETSTIHNTHHDNNLTMHNIKNPTQNLSQGYSDLNNPPKHNKGRNALNQPQPMEIIHPAPKPYIN